MTQGRQAIATLAVLAAGLGPAGPAGASVGDPQVMTDHPFHPGELSCSTFERLWATQEALYERETGRPVVTDLDRAIASWYWRNLHQFHCDLGVEDIWDDGFEHDSSRMCREYWMGLFGYGFAHCGTTHSQWCGEMEGLLGHGRARVMGVSEGHNSFEVFMTDIDDWVLLDQNLSTIIFDEAETSLLSIRDIAADPTVIDNGGAPDHNRGWLISGLYYESPVSNDLYAPGDGYFVYREQLWREESSGYAGAPPMVRLRRGETLRRYLQPGLGGETWAFWGRSFQADGIPGPSCDHAWVGSPELMYRATEQVPRRPLARFANAVFTYEPGFADGSYREALVSETAEQVTLEFFSPYTIAATPPGAPASWGEWDIYEDGTRNGLVVASSAIDATVQLSTDDGQTWSPPRALDGSEVDLTDLARSHHGYQLRLNAAPAVLAEGGISIRTVCQAGVMTMPHLVAGANGVTYEATGRAVFAAGPNRDQAEAYVVEGAFDSADPIVMEVPTPRGERIVAVHAAMWVASGIPPEPTVAYAIEYDVGGGYRPVVRDWHLANRGYDPGDSWSQSFVFGGVELAGSEASSVRVRFSNDGGMTMMKAEVYLVYEDAHDSPVRVAFGFADASGDRVVEHEYPAGSTARDSSWTFEVDGEPTTRWVEMSVPAGPVPEADADADADADGDADGDADADADADAGPGGDGCGCRAASPRRSPGLARALLGGAG